MTLRDLHADDLAQLLELGHVIHECDDAAALARRTSEALQRMVGADIVVWNELTVDRKVSTGMTFPDPGATFWVRHAPGMFAHLHEHPFIRELDARNPAHLTAAISDFLPTGRFAESGLYHNGYREFQARHQMSSARDTTGGEYLVLSLNRVSKDFTAREKAILECVTRQATAAYQNLRRVDHLTNRLWALALGRGDIDSTWLCLDERMIILWADPGLDRFLREHFQHPTADLFLPPLLAAPVRESLRQWRANQVAGDQRVATHRLRHAGCGYRMLFDGKAPGIYRLIVAATGVGTTGNTLSESLGELSRREREVASWASEGKTNPEIALILGISPRTVEKHVHAALAKLGLENRVQLARLLHGDNVGSGWGPGTVR